MPTALVTGASSGIGFSLVEALLHDGYRVAGTGRSAERLDAARQRLGAGERFLGLVADGGDPVAVSQAFEAIDRQFGALDLLVNNAGQFLAKPFVDFTAAEIDAQIAANLKGMLYASQAAARRMCARRSGRIISITAALALKPDNRIPALMNVALKGALHHATRALALELAPYGVTVNAVAPGVVATPMHPVDPQAAYGAMHPLGRIASVGEVCDAVRFLACADHVTGVVLPIDGGTSAGQWSS